MGVFESKLRYAQESNSQESETTLSKNTNPPVSLQEIIYWEKIYKERFARTFVFSTHTSELFSTPGIHPPSEASWEWHLDPDSASSRCNPRYVGATPEPLSTELAEQTRHELRNMNRRALLHSYLREWLHQLWLPELNFVPRVPYLTDEVISPRASEIKNGHILPARIRSHISGEPEETPLDRDAFSKQRVKDWGLWPRALFDDYSQLPDDNMLLSRCTWLNQTTTIYFEPEFEKRGHLYSGVPYIGCGLFGAWQKFDRERGEEPNLQQKRRICDALADAQDKPVSPKDPYSWVEHGAEMGVVYPSVIIVVDEARTHWGFRSEAEARETMFERFRVLLVRTGNEEHLSEPVDFSSLGDAILPLGRDELLQDNQQVVRVRLDTAVRFIMNLERREQDRCPCLTAIKKILDEDTVRGADKFAADALAMAEENGGIDRNFDTWEAVRRARAYLDGEPFHVDPKLAEDEKQRVYSFIRFW